MSDRITVFLETGILSINRGVCGEPLMLLSDCLYEAGVRCMEIPYDQLDPDRLCRTASCIRALVQRHPDMLIGAGTVLCQQEAENAEKAGAAFLVSPNANPDVIRRTRQLGLISIPGAMTPGEIEYAWRLGADIVKVFPADHLGPAYFRSVTTPLSHIPLLAAGGITEENMPDYLRSGCRAVGLGSSLSKPALIESGDWAAIGALARKYISVFQGLRHAQTP